MVEQRDVKPPLPGCIGNEGGERRGFDLRRTLDTGDGRVFTHAMPNQANAARLSHSSVSWVQSGKI